MTLADVTHEGVLAAVAEFDRLGRDKFLRSAGFGRAREYFLEYEDRLYDSKAIAGYAHRVSTGKPLDPGDFSGGDKTVSQRLTALNFTVRHLPVLDWKRDEITLACELVEANGWKQLDDKNPGVQELSELLRRVPTYYPLESHYPSFRNPAGVARKTLNIASVHPGWSGAPSNGNKLDREVMDDFRTHPVSMRAMAARIRELLTDEKSAGDSDVPDLDTDDLAASEGGVALRSHLRRERDLSLRRAKIADSRRGGSPVACEACGFDFGRVYGSHGLDYIECHHRVPLHVTGKTRTRLADLALLCSNCHRMIHRAKQWLTIEELKNIIAEQRLPAVSN